MKRIRKSCLILFLICFCFDSYCQNNIFFLVDVSGNPLNMGVQTHITYSERQEAISLASDLIKGTFIKNKYANWKASHLNSEIQNIYDGKGTSLLQQNSYLIIMPYGDHDRYKDFEIYMLNNIPVDFDRAISKTKSFKYGDQSTFESLARAKAADIALDQNFKDYYLICISGLGGDNTGSQPFTLEENNFIKNYEGGAQLVPCGTFSYSDRNKTFGIVIHKVDISILANGKNITQGGQIGIVQPANLPDKKLEIAGNSSNPSKPLVIKEGAPLSISWRCLGCDPNPTFNISVKGTNNTRYSKNYSQKNNTHLSLNLEKGTYKITVRSSCGLQSKPLFVKMEGKSGGGFFLIILLLALLGLGGYKAFKYLFRDNYQKNIIKEDDGFKVPKPTKTKDHNSNTNNTDNGYF